MIIQSAPPGPASLFTIAAFGRPDAQLQQQLQVRNQQTQQYLLQNYGYDASSFFNSSKQFFNTYEHLSGIKQAEAMVAMGKVDNVVAIANNIFTPIVDMAGFQNATLHQQNYLMANPVVREAYLRGQLCGYDSTYTNHWGNNVGMDDPVYRQAVSGLSLHSYGTLPDDVDDSYTECLDDPIPGLEPLSAVEQSNLAQAWKLQNVMYNEGIDTTHPDLNPIGD